jgi:hypothetical protein
MSNLFTTEKGSHWYTQDGQPLYTVLKKDGKPRNTTLADARKLGLVPSVTGIIGILAKPQLEAYKQEQAVLAALTLPRLESESDQAFAKRVVQDAEEHVGNAADLGTEFHQFAEGYLSARKDARDVISRPAGIPVDSLVAWIGWCYKNLPLVFQDYPRIWGREPIAYQELSIASSYGYGGKIDWVGELDSGIFALIDWKTQNVKTGKEPNFYEAYDLQLAAYAHAVTELGWSIRLGIPEIEKRISVIISTNPDNPGCWAQEWDHDDEAFEAFESLLKVWKWQKNYDPSDVVVEEKQEVMA